MACEQGFRWMMRRPPSAIAGIVVTIARWQAAKRLGRDPGLFGLIMSIAVPLIPAALVYFLYPA